MADINQIKERIQEITGIPSDIIKGESLDEVMNHSKELLSYRYSSDGSDDTQKTAREQFSDYFQRMQGIEPLSKIQALNDLESELRRNEGYPVLHDGGSILINDVCLPDSRPVKDQFAEFFMHF